MRPKTAGIKMIDKPNSGYGASMNCGLDAARGEYIRHHRVGRFGENHKTMFAKLPLCEASRLLRFGEVEFLNTAPAPIPRWSPLRDSRTKRCSIPPIAKTSSRCFRSFGRGCTVVRCFSMRTSASTKRPARRFRIRRSSIASGSPHAAVALLHGGVATIAWTSRKLVGAMGVEDPRSMRRIRLDRGVLCAKTRPVYNSPRFCR